MERRDFIVKSAASLAGISILSQGLTSCSSGKTREIGIQLYSMATALSDDFAGTLKMLAEAGYKNLEFAGPYYFSPKEEIENNVLIQQMGLKGYGYYDHTPEDLKLMLDDLGLKSISAHISDMSLEYNMEEILNAAKIIGHKYLISPMFIGMNIDDYKRAAEKYNKFGEATKKAGIQFAYHNHSQEFANYDGEIPFEVLLKETDPGLVAFELDLFWATVAGIDPVKLIKDNPGRIRLLHVKDMAKKMDAPNTDWHVFRDMSIGRPILENQTIVGTGVIDFKDIFNKLKDTSAQNIIIESDFPPDPVKFARESIANLKLLI